jgi:prepilin-type N-terminal cleavage/methylation domain-containing protein
MRRRGFTLVELIAAIMVTVLVVSATGVLLRGVAAARDRVEQDLDAQQQAWSAAQAVAVVFANASRPPEAKQLLLEGTDDWIGDISADRVRLFTTSTREIRSGRPESDVREVEFFLSTEDGSSAAVLFRRTDPTRNAEPDGGGVVERIAGDIVGFDVRYHNGKDWQDEWPATPGAWPILVRVRVEVLIDSQRNKTFTLSRTINFPYMGGA